MKPGGTVGRRRKMNEMNEKTEIVNFQVIKSILCRKKTERQEELIMNKQYCYAAVILFSFLVAGVEPVHAINIPGDDSYYGIIDGIYVLNQSVNETINIVSDGITFDGNAGAGYTVSGGTSDSGVYVYDRSGVTIMNVNVQGFYNGIYVRGTGVPGSGSTLEQHSTGNTVTNNTIDSYSSGIRLDYCSDNSVTDNTVSNCGGFGISLVHSSDYDILPPHNPPPGNTVTGNTLSNNYWGIYIQWACNNTIYHNNFINNTIQAEHYSGSGNVFNLPWPDGGNYWNDWTSPDNDNNGFVDLAYVIPYVYDPPDPVQDNFPWTDEDGWLTSRISSISLMLLLQTGH